MKESLYNRRRSFINDSIASVWDSSEASWSSFDI
jgi:hypothetical protein